MPFSNIHSFSRLMTWADVAVRPQVPTVGQPEKRSVYTRKWWPASWKRSEAAPSNGQDGGGLTRRDSGAWEGRRSAHAAQLRTTLRISFVMDGQWTTCRARRRVRSWPRWEECSSWRTSCRRRAGTTTREPYMTIPSAVHRS